MGNRQPAIRQPEISPHSGALGPIRNSKCLIPGVGRQGVTLNGAL